MKSFLGNFYKHLAIFSGHTGGDSIKPLGRVEEGAYTSRFARLGGSIVNGHSRVLHTCHR